eukprot:TRINITY_DN1158_c2_g1_i1.p1 TRINITY_DN1158_c2_g1~~TRINITY_DN1158_c2_g1_i1.p1  ORF type:complete len:316 (-),score=120.56 TRINITY_DN1158_c2_g1_i1:158-1057(-)
MATMDKPAAPVVVKQPLWKNVVAGGTAGIMEVLCMYPTDVVKTRQQLGTGKTVPMITQFKDIIKNEGFANLYRGIASPILAEAPKRAIKFSLNEKYKEAVKKKDGTLPGYRAAMAGALAGMTECSVNTPFEVVKVQMQAKENLGRYTGVVDCVQSLVRTEGALSLYKGVESQLWRNAVWNGVYFGMIGGLKSGALKAPADASKQQKTLYDFGAGVVGGTLATLANTPFDVVKSRMQNQLVIEGQAPKYQWTLPSMGAVYSEEGLNALYKGIGPRLVRLGPGGGIMLVAFNAVIELLEKY